MANTVSPYKILALAPFAPVPEGIYKPVFTDVDLYCLDDAVKKMEPVLYLPMDSSPGGAVTLTFKAMKDFKPKNLVKNNPVLSSLVPAFESSTAKPVEKKQGQAGKVDDILSMVAEPDSSRVSKGDGTKSGQNLGYSASLLTEIYATAEFKEIERAWTGLQTLAKTAGVKGIHKIHARAASVSRASLGQVLDAIESLDMEEMPNLIVVDLGFDNSQPSIDLLEKIADFADRMMVPVFVWIKPEFFRIENFTQFHKIQYVGNHLDDISYAKFRKIKEHPGAAWIMALCNAFAVRPANDYEEDVPLVSPVWAAAGLCAASVDACGWPTSFTRYNTFRLENLAMIVDGNHAASTQALFSEDRIMQMVESGITPVVGMKNKDMAFIPKSASLNGESIRFTMFFNRIIDGLTHLGKDLGENNADNEAMIAKALERLFVETGHQCPDDISITQNQSGVYNISFTPPDTVISGTGRLEFSFAF
ncbi:type VI secretion system contractile sheath domain-containing protein [uncultured Desulfobacter sp.]|uniref:type VI secretion system contractile sheath domain-containing protein n=1 Tax=uncultured Desulfobacter sp. TaxID=240139 RepID=UPI002AABCBCF|nr:type VI secretion system contractile sheath large subunit [uncultured Desulfobacter sp.]